MIADITRRLLLLIPAAAALAAFDSQDQTITLPSGKRIKILGIGKIFFSQGPPALMLKYQTELSIDDKSALEKEVDEIWEVFRKDVENAQLTSGIVSANEKPTGFIITHSRGFNFVFTKSAIGEWSRME